MTAVSSEVFAAPRARTGMPTLAPAVATGIALHAVETLVGVTFGVAGVFALGSRTVRRRIAVAALVPGLAALAGLLGIWVMDLT